MDIKIDSTELERELACQPAYFLAAAEKHVAAEAQVNEFKNKIERLEAKLDKDARAELLKDGKFTEKMVAAWINTHKAYKEATDHLVTLKASCDMLKAQREAWHMRKDMLIELCRRDRDELKSMLSTDKRVALGQ